MSEAEIPAELVSKLREELGPKGTEFFRALLREHGRINVVLDRGPGMPPHPVHLREGMSVRNWMRSTRLCVGWDAHDYDENWITAVCRAILPDSDGDLVEPEVTDER